MCGRFARATDKQVIARTFALADVSAVPDLPPSYNVPPSRPAYVVGSNPAAGRRGLAVMTWGLVPRWWKGPLKAAPKPFNARADGVGDRSTFRDSFHHRRCVVPADGFYEWQKTPGGTVPHFFRPAGGGVFALAGVWDAWTDPGTGGRVHTFATITTEPNKLLAAVHDRMPVILPPDAWADWLDPATPVARLRALLAPCPSEGMEGFPVAPLVNSPANDGPDLVRAA